MKKQTLLNQRLKILKLVVHFKTIVVRFQRRRARRNLYILLSRFKRKYILKSSYFLWKKKFIKMNQIHSLQLKIRFHICSIAFQGWKCFIKNHRRMKFLIRSSLKSWSLSLKQKYLFKWTEYHQYKIQKKQEILSAEHLYQQNSVSFLLNLFVLSSLSNTEIIKLENLEEEDIHDHSISSLLETENDFLHESEQKLEIPQNVSKIELRNEFINLVKNEFQSETTLCSLLSIMKNFNSMMKHDD